MNYRIPKFKRHFAFLKHFSHSLFLLRVKLKIGYCPYCDGPKFFLRTSSESYRIRCLGCKSTIISLSMIKVLNRLNIFFDCTYELSSYGAVFNFLKKKSKKFVFSEFFEGSNSRFINKLRNEDVQRLSFDDNHFNLVTCTEVLEHVPNYKLGILEVFRVLKPNGYFCFTVPIFLKFKAISKINSDGSLLWFDTPEYHGSRFSGDNSVPVFWHFSKNQLLNDLNNAGFRETKAISCKWIFGVTQTVFIAKK